MLGMTQFPALSNIEPIDPKATLDLLARWDAEDATTDPEEIAAHCKEVEEFKQAMNDNRLQAEGASSRKIYPRARLSHM